MRFTRLTLAVLAGAALLPAAPVLAGASGAGSGATVRLKDTRIAPSRVTIRMGGSVTWRFLDGGLAEAHNVTSYGRRSFRSSGDREFGAYTVRFARPGVYRYHCTIHFNMVGEVVVR